MRLKLIGKAAVAFAFTANQDVRAWWSIPIQIQPLSWWGKAAHRGAQGQQGSAVWRCTLHHHGRWVRALTHGLCFLVISLWQILSAGFVQTHWQGQLRLLQLNSLLCFCHSYSSPFPSPFSLCPHAAPSVTAQHSFNSLNSAKASTSTEPHTTSKRDDSARKVGLWSQEQRKEEQEWIVATICFMDQHLKGIKFVKLAREKDSWNVLKKKKKKIGQHSIFLYT